MSLNAYDDKKAKNAPAPAQPAPAPAPRQVATPAPQRQVQQPAPQRQVQQPPQQQRQVQQPLQQQRQVQQPLQQRQVQQPAQQPRQVQQQQTPQTVQQGAAPRNLPARQPTQLGNTPNQTGRQPTSQGYPQNQTGRQPTQLSSPQNQFGRQPTPQSNPQIQSGRQPGYQPIPTAAQPRRAFTSPSGDNANFRGGTVHTLNTQNGMSVNHVGANRESITRHGDRTVVTNAGGHGYVQRDVVVRNQRFVQRTYYDHGARYAHVYRPYYYRGTYVNVYTPVRYYRPAFYSYAYGNPWRTPIYYQWGWVNDPWYGAYGGVYFNPYPAYPRPSLWLTDYLIASSFQEAYQTQVDAGIVPQRGNFQDGAPMDDSVKQQISEEVQRQLQWERKVAQQQDAPPQTSEPLVVADHIKHTLVAFSSLNADASGGQECVVTEGDVLQFDASQPMSGTAGNVQVIWSKPNDCIVGSMVALPVEQLQEMQNHMFESLNQGMQAMQTQQGQNGLPALAPTVVGTNQAAFARELPTPDPNVSDELKAQAQEANNAVDQVTQEANRAWAPPSPPQQVEQAIDRTPATTLVVQAPVTIVKGMTVNQVIAALGPPTNNIDTGKKQILVYPSLKITFEKGKVHKVE